jgi:hypothetical protein
MTTITLLQLFLLVDVFFAGVVASIGVRHAYAHFRPHQPETEKPHSPAADNRLPTEVKERLFQTSQAHFQAVLDHSAAQLQRDLEATAAQINKNVGHMATEIVGDELENYRKELDRLRKQAETSMGDIRSEVTKHHAELETKLADELKTEKQWLVQQIDTKLADAVGSFLLDTLQHNVDLGSQSAYLTAMLEEHKADFIKEVADESQAAS